MNRPRESYVATRMRNFGAILKLPDPCSAFTC